MVDSAGVIVVTHPAAATEKTAPFQVADLPALRIGQLAGAEELQFSAVTSARRLADGDFVIVDRQARAVRIFDGDGRFVRSLGGVGQGPGEFTQPLQVFEDSEGRLLVWDQGQRRFTAFGREGTVLDPPASPGVAAVLFRTGAALPGGDFLVLGEGTAVSQPGRQARSASLLRVGQEGRVDTLGIFPGAEMDVQVVGGEPTQVILATPWYFPQLLAGATGESVWASRGTEWEVARRRVDDGSVDRVVRFARPLEPFSARLEEIHARELERAASASAAAGIERAQGEREYPDFLPPIADLFADGAERVWIGLLEPPPPVLPAGMGREVQEWLLLASEGEEVVGRLSLPPRSRPLYADHDGVLLVVVDDLDVPYVEWRLFEAHE